MWIIDKNDTVSILLNGSPALLILEVTGGIPQLDMNFAEICDTWGRITLKVNNSILKLDIVYSLEISANFRVTLSQYLLKNNDSNDKLTCNP